MEQLVRLETLTADSFAPHVGTSLAMQLDDESETDLTLTEVRRLGQFGPGRRNPFSLLFKSARGVVHPQRIYRLTHPEMGTMEIFLVPIGADSQGVRYEAVFG